MNLPPPLIRCFVLLPTIALLAVVNTACSATPEREPSHQGPWVIARPHDQTVRLEWALPSGVDADEFVVWRDDRRVARLSRGLNDRRVFAWRDDLDGVSQMGDVQYRVEARWAGESVGAWEAAPVRATPPLVHRLARTLIVHDVDDLQLYAWESTPYFEAAWYEEAEPVPLESEWRDVGLVDALARGDVAYRDEPTASGWRLESYVDWEVRPWVSEYVFMPRYRLLRTWRLELHAGDQLVWRDQETSGYGIERVGAPYDRVRRWADPADRVSALRERGDHMTRDGGYSKRTTE